MKPNRAELSALSHANGQAAIDAAYAILKTDAEAVRAAYWTRLPEKVRMMVCHMAGVDAKKGKGALRDLTALERGKIHCEARRLMKSLDHVMRCAQGGELPVTAPLFGHAADGIAGLQ